MKKEKCYCCNGSGKTQKFNNLTEKWERSSDPCLECEGLGFRLYKTFHSGKNFLFSKVDMKIEFTNPCYEGNGKHYQDIEIDGKCEGCLLSREMSVLLPIEERYQRCVKDIPENRKHNYYESEDEGYIFVWFDSLENFVDFYLKDKK